MTRKQTARVAAVCGLLGNALSSALASDHTYTGPINGSWNNSTYWQPTGVPNNGDGAIFQNADSTNRSITGDITVGTLTTLRIGNSGSGVTTLNQNANVNYTINVEVVGQGDSTGAVSGNAVHIQNGGLNTYMNFLSVGAGSGSQTGTYTLAGGSILFTGAGGGGGAPGLFVGTHENGVFNQNAGTVTIGSATTPTPIYIGFQTGGAGTYNMGASAQQLNVYGDFRLGDHGNGTFIQSGGTVSVASTGGFFVADYDAPFSGTTNAYYELDGGTLNAANGETMGEAFGTGTFDQKGGLNSTTSLLLGDGPNANGLYQLQGGTLLVSGDERYSYSGVGTFAQSGGVHVLGSASAPVTLTIGSIHISEYSLSNTGSLTVFGTVVDGQNGLGIYDQSGGSAIVHGDMYLGGTASTMVLGDSTLNLSAGALTITGTLKAWTGTLSTADYINLSGGALSIGTLDTSGDPTRLNWTAGTLTFTNGLTVGAGGPLGTNANLASTLVNKGVLTLTGGSTTGPGHLSNQNLLTGNGTLGGTGGIDNAGIILPSTSGITITNTGSFDNRGNIQLAPSALLSLSGGTFINDGPGLISLEDGIITGNTITNQASISGRGSITNPITNTGNIDAVGGTLYLSGVLTNQSLGQVSAESGAKISAPNFTDNFGIVALLGGELDTVNETFNNDTTGKVTGHGTIHTTGLSNDGSMIFTGGPTDLFGQFGNFGSVTITGNSVTTFYSDVFTTAGSITVNANSTAVFLGSVSGQSMIVGPGTKDFEGASSGGAVASIVGSTIVGPGANVSADFIHENALSIDGKASINPTASANTSVSIVKSLYIDPTTARFDLGNNSLMIDYTGTSPLPTIASDIKSAYAAGGWTGNGLTSSAAFANHKTALGYAEASALGISNFDGQPIDSTTLLAAYTWFGDANLDGTVNALDFNALATNYGKNSGSDVWSQGDFNYDGTVNSSDFDSLAANFGQMMPSSVDTPQDVISLGAVVPEPVMLAMFMFGTWPLKRPRRGRSR